MAKIDKSESNLYSIPKGANVLKTGAVYINDRNYKVEPKDGRKPYVSHVKLCIGKISEKDKTKFYANANYRKKYLKQELPQPPEKNDSLSVGVYAAAVETDKAVEVTKTLLESGFQEEEVALLKDLALYMLEAETAVFQHFPAWARNNATFSEMIVDDTQISKFLKELGFSRIQLFKDNWLRKILRVGDKLFLCYDSTNVNSQATGVSIVEKGHAKDDSTLNQVNTEYVVRQADGMPVAYMQYPGSIVDIAEAEKMIQYIGKFNKDVKIVVVCDRGYISEDNVTSFNEQGLDYLLLVKSNLTAAKKILEAHVEEVRDVYSAYIPEEDKFGKVFREKLFSDSDIESYVYLIFDKKLEYEHRNALINKIRLQKAEIERAIERKTKFTADNLKKYYLFSLELELSETIIAPKRGPGAAKVEQPSYVIKGYREDDEKIKKEFSFCGFFILASSQLMKVLEALTAYSRRDSVEKVFQCLKSFLGMDKYGVHSEASMHGKTFLWFIASVLRSHISNKLGDLRASSGDRKTYTTPASLDSLAAIQADKNLSTGKYERRYSLTKKQKEICKALSIEQSLIDEIIANLS